MDLDAIEMDDSMMGQADQLENVLARLRQEDEAAAGHTNNTRNGNLSGTSTSPRGCRRDRSPHDDQVEKRPKHGYEGDFMSNVSNLFKQMTETFKSQKEERDQWRKPIVGENSSATPTNDNPIMINWLNYDVKDDATTVVDLELRNAIRPLNMKPELYWKKFDRIAKPCLEAIENSHISHIMVNPKVVQKMHDRSVMWFY